MSNKWWNFQGYTGTPKVSTQEILELTALASGLLEFQKTYLTTHGEKVPVSRVLSMIVRFIDVHGSRLDSYLASIPITDKVTDKNDIPF